MVVCSLWAVAGAARRVAAVALIVALGGLAASTTLAAADARPEKTAVRSAVPAPRARIVPPEAARAPLEASTRESAGLVVDGAIDVSNFVIDGKCGKPALRHGDLVPIRRASTIASGEGQDWSFI